MLDTDALILLLPFISQKLWENLRIVMFGTDRVIEMLSLP